MHGIARSDQRAVGHPNISRLAPIAATRPQQLSVQQGNTNSPSSLELGFGFCLLVSTSFRGVIDLAGSTFVALGLSDTEGVSVLGLGLKNDIIDILRRFESD